MFKFRKAAKWIAGAMLTVSLALYGVNYARNKIVNYYIDQAQESENLEHTINNLNKAKKLDPNNPNISKKKGDAEQRKGDSDEANRDYEDAVKKRKEEDPRIPPKVSDIEKIVNSFGNKPHEILKRDQGTENSLASSFYASGLQKIKLGDLKGALEDLNKSIAEDPEFVEAYMERGVLEFKVEDYNGAFNDFNEVINKDSDNEHGLLAYAYHDLGLSRYFLSVQINGIESQKTENIRNISVWDIDEAIKIYSDIAGFYETRGNLEYESGIFNYEYGLEDKTAWAWADYDYDMTATLLIKQEGEIKNKDIFCRWGRVKKALDDTKNCNKFRNICIDSFNKGDVKSFPKDYFCLVIEYDPINKKKVRYEYNVLLNDFIPQ